MHDNVYTYAKIPKQCSITLENQSLDHETLTPHDQVDAESVCSPPLNTLKARPGASA